MRNFAPILALAFLASCATYRAPVAYTPDDVLIDAPAAEVWQALTIVYTDLDIPIENMDRDSWFMRSDEMIADWLEDDALFDCGGRSGMLVGDTPNTIGARVTASITTLLVPEGDQTRVRNRVSARTDTGQDCESTGVYEANITEALEELVG